MECKCRTQNETKALRHNVLHKSANFDIKSLTVFKITLRYTLCVFKQSIIGHRNENLLPRKCRIFLFYIQHTCKCLTHMLSLNVFDEYFAPLNLKLENIRV